MTKSTPQYDVDLFERALQEIVALDFEKIDNGRDDLYSGRGRFIKAWLIATRALGIPDELKAMEARSRELRADARELDKECSSDVVDHVAASNRRIADELDEWRNRMRARLAAVEGAKADPPDASRRAPAEPEQGAYWNPCAKCGKPRYKHGRACFHAFVSSAPAETPQEQP